MTESTKPSDLAARPRRSWRTPTAWALSIVLALGVGWWAAVTAATPPQVSVADAEPVTTEVVDGSVSVEQPYGITASWPTTPRGVNGAAGTVTSLALEPAGRQVTAGEVLFTVDLAPVVAAAGAVPAFRDLAFGATGEDVRQLQAFLVDRGLLSIAPDGRFGPSTARAVAAWSESLGLGRVEVVPLGRIVFLPELPAALAPAPELRVGARVQPGDELLVGAASEPAFTFRVLPEQAATVTEGTTVTIDVGSTWQARVARIVADVDDPSVSIAELEPIDEATSICGDECAEAVALGAEAVLPGRLILVPETSGPTVPTAAIATDAAGEPSVTLADGTKVTVRVLASADGRSVVEGVSPGDRVRMPGPG